MKPKIFITLLLTAMCGMYFYFNAMAKEKIKAGDSSALVAAASQTSSCEVNNTKTEARGAIGSTDMTATSVAGVMGATGYWGMCGYNTTTGAQNCCAPSSGCSSCTLATACRGETIDLTVVDWSASGPPYNPASLSPVYWGIYISCTGWTAGPLYTPIFSTASSTYSLNTATMPAGIYWIAAGPTAALGVGYYQIEIVDCPKKGECNRCECSRDLWYMSDFEIDNLGYAFVRLNLTSTISNVAKFRITLVNYHSDADLECLKCDIAGQEMFGDIIYAFVPYGANNPEFAPYYFDGPASFSREVTWCFEEPGEIVADDYILGLRFPPVSNLECCANYVSFCLRIEVWDDRCTQCDVLVCYRYDGESGIVKPNHKEINHKKIHKGDLQAIPNPAEGNFDIKITKDDLPGIAMIYDADGSMVDQLNINTETTNINSKNWKPGTYFIRYVGKNGSSSGKIVVGK